MNDLDEEMNESHDEKYRSDGCKWSGLIDDLGIELGKKTK